MDYPTLPIGFHWAPLRGFWLYTVSYIALATTSTGRLFGRAVEPLMQRDIYIYIYTPFDLCFDRKRLCFGSKTGVNQVLGLYIMHTKSRLLHILFWWLKVRAC